MDYVEREARHLTELQNLELILNSMGFQSQLLQKSDPMPTHALVTRIPMPEGQEPVEMALTFYPVEPDTVEDTLLLQYYIQLPYNFDDEALESYRRLVPDMNGKAVVGHFGLDVASRKAHYRYVQAIPADRPITKALVADVVILVAYTPPLFADLLHAVETNSLDEHMVRTWSPPPPPR